MDPLNAADLPDGALLLVDSSPIIYVLEQHPKLATRFMAVFEAQASGRLKFAVTSVAIAEVLTGPLQSGDEVLARRYRAVLESWNVIPLDVEIAESAARLRASFGLKLPDAVHAASALAVHAAGLVTHNRDFSRIGSLRVIC